MWLQAARYECGCVADQPIGFCPRKYYSEVDRHRVTTDQVPFLDTSTCFSSTSYYQVDYFNMSFADLERGQGGFQSSSGLVPSSSSEAEFLGLQKSLSVQIFKINSNVQGILKLVDQLGTARDTGTVRKGL
jgi:hypothetical protein